MNSTFWTLKYLRSGEEKTFAEWGIAQECSRELLSAAPDRFTFRIENLPVDSDPPLAIDESVWIKRNGQGFFLGRITRISRSATPRSETFNYEVSGPWWYLDVTPFLQQWQEADDPDNPNSALSPQNRSRVILFQDLDGSKLTTAEMISAVQTFGLAHFGGQFAAGTISLPAVEPPFSELRDQTCGEVIKSILRWHPDAVTWFDYTVNPPLLNIASRGNCTPVSLAIADSPVAGLTITPRNDLLCSGVILIYEVPHSINEVTWTTRSIDQVGTLGPRSVVATVELGGSSRTVQAQKVSISSIDLTARSFWESLLPWLHQATGVTIENVRLNGVLVTGQAGDTADGTSGYSGMGLADFTGAALAPTPSNAASQNVLTGGQVPHWLESQFMDSVVTCKISYTLTNPETGSEDKKEKVPFTTKLKVSALNSSPFPQTFEQITASTEGEPVPIGVAAAYYAAASVLHYEGQFTLVEDEVSAARGVGNVLNLTGGPGEWATMNALIQAVSEQLASGTTVYRFGPPGHLNPGDFVELQRVQRGRSPSFRLKERVDGRFQSAGAEVNGAIQVVQGANAPSHQPGKAVTLGTKDDEMPGKIKINVEDLKAALISLGVTPATAADPHMTLRIVDACDFSTDPPTAGKMAVLASAFIPNP